jgi:Transcription activator MBF2
MDQSVAPKRISYILVEIEQTSDQNEVKITAGGIHQDHVAIEIKSQKTLYHCYHVHIFG